MQRTAETAAAAGKYWGEFAEGRWRGGGGGGAEEGRRKRGLIERRTYGQSDRVGGAEGGRGVRRSLESCCRES